MTELFLQIHRYISNSTTLESRDLTEYVLFVCQQIPNIKKSYQQNLSTQLSEWMEVVGNSIKNTLNSRKTNQIGPKLELIYTTVINQQQAVNQYIKKIADLILKENYYFLTQNDCTFKKTGLKYTETSQSAKKEENTFKSGESDSFYNSKQKTILKGRSLSNGSQRRKLSKVSCFAQAKKVENESNKFVQTATATQAFYKPRAGKNIKKTKKKEENAFSYLQKCISSTSASNFMLGYMAKADYRREHQDTRGKSRSNDKIDQKCKESIVFTDTAVHNIKNQLSVPLGGQGHSRNDSGTYEKMMISFQEKIGQKLDELMNKYTKIEQKLQEKQVQPSNKRIKGEPQFQISVHPPQQVKQNQSVKQKIEVKQQPSEMISLQSKVTYVERQVKKVNKQKQNEKQSTHTKISTNNLNKSIMSKNKIVRNRVEQPVAQEESLESITLPQTSFKTLNLSQNKNKQPSMLTLANVQVLQSKIVSKVQADAAQQQIKKIKDDNHYIFKQITEFNKTTLKAILPISKKLLFIIKKKYQSFCNKHKIEMVEQIGNIQTEEVKNEVAELRDSLQKMQKILQLKCNQQKKQKLVLYVCCFLRCYLSFSDQDTVIRLPSDVINEQTACNKIKESISRLR